MNTQSHLTSADVATRPEPPTASEPSPTTTASLPRRSFLKLSAGAAAGVVGSQFLGLVMPQRAQAEPLPQRKNLILIITDQERPPMWFPPGWEAANLPHTMRLKNHGLTFKYAFTSASMCTASRNSMFTGLFVARHHSPDVLTEGFPESDLEHQLDPTLPNLATCLTEAGYDVIYKGKWHMSSRVEAANGSPVEDDLARYGLQGWDPPDAGGDTAAANFGGANAQHTVKNDQRFVNDAIAFLNDRISHPTGKPYCLILSLVNPHDVLSYPSGYNDQTGYQELGDPWLAANSPAVQFPPTLTEDLSTKPAAQQELIGWLAYGLGLLNTDARKHNYLNFYGRLMAAVDRQIGQVLNVLDPKGDGTGAALNDALIIRTADHGEMALSHNSLRQKMFVAYEEIMRVPMIWSNPGLFPTAKTTDAIVSHVDLLPTICELAGVPNWRAKGFQGMDYSHVILHPDTNTSPTAAQPYVLFTFDDIYAGNDRTNPIIKDGLVPPPNRLQVVRTPDFKLVRYWDGNGSPPVADQGEFYDLRPKGDDYYVNDGAGGKPVYNAAGPLEAINLSDVGFTPPPLTDEQKDAYATLKAILQMETSSGGRLVTTPLNAAAPPSDLKLEIVPWTDGTTPKTAVQITFYSRENTKYQLQKSTNLTTWNDVGDVILGNNGPVLRNDDLVDPKAFYRIQWSAVT